MTDLFATLEPPRRLKVGQANGEFLAKLALLTPNQRAKVKPEDFPEACPKTVRRNVAFHGGAK